MGNIQHPIWRGKCPLCNNPEVNDVYCHTCGTQLIQESEAGGALMAGVIWLASVLLITLGVSFFIAAFTEHRSTASCPNLGIAENCKMQKGELSIVSTTEGTTFTCVVKK